MTPEQRQALRQRIKEACGADLGPCEPPKPEQYWCDACLALAALETAEQENKLLRDNERFKDGLIHDQRQRAEQAEAQLAALTAPPAPPRKACPYGDPACPCQDGDSCHYEDTVDTQAMAPPAPHAEAVRVLEEAWWRGRLSATARQGEWAGPELRERCGKDIADVLAALRAEGEGGQS